jgi:hypothetical protein
MRQIPMRKTIQSIAALTAALCLAWSYPAVAQQFRGTFEAPFVDVALQTEVPGSEGKIGDEGQFKVEINTAPDSPLQICLVTENLEPLFLADVVSDEDGELKVEGTLPLGASIPTTLQAPRFQVLTGAPATCGGGVVFESGLTVTVPVEGTVTGAAAFRKKVDGRPSSRANAFKRRTP